MANKKTTISTTPTATLVADVSAKFNQIPKKITKELIQSFLDCVESHVSAGSKVRIDKIGILTVKDRAARKGRNPQSGEEIAIPASKKVAFKVASSLKEAVGLKKKKESKASSNKKTPSAKPSPSKKK